MRKTAITLLALGIAAIAAPFAQATVLVSEGFGYANGNLIGNGGWINYGALGATDVQVVSGRAVGGGPTNPATDDHKPFAPQSLTTKTYACFEVMIPTPLAPGAPKPIYFAALKDGGTAALVSRVYVLAVAGGWTFGLSHSSTSTTVGVVPWTSALTYDTSYRVVINYDPVAKTSTMWVNPSVESDPSVSITNTAVAALAVSTFALRQSVSSSTLPASPSYTGAVDWSFSVDNLGVGTTFDDACYQATPTHGKTWGQLKTLYR